MTRNNVCTRRMATENGPNLVNLVRCGSVHSILAIKMGSVSRFPNVDPHGRPALKFKELSSIYDCEGVNKLNSGTTVKWHAIRAKGSSVDSQVKVEVASPEKGACPGKSTEAGDIQSSRSIFLKKEVDLDAIHDGDELSRLTLREFKNRCKRQKVIESNASLGPNDHAGHCAVSCKDNSDRPMKVEPDLDEPLIVLKQRMSKDSKPERKRKKNAHQYNSDASSPVQTRNEEEQPSYFGVAEHALSTDSAVSFHLIEIKEEVLETDSYDIDNVVPAVNISASSSVSDADCLVAQGSEEIQRDEPEIGESVSMRGNMSDCSTDEVFIPESHNLGKDAMEIYSCMKEMDSSDNRSPEVACTVRSETLQAESFGEHDPVTVSDCSASDLLAKCHFPDNMWDCLNNGCDMGDRRRPTFADISQYSSLGEVSVPDLSLGHISLLESAGMNSDAGSSEFPPLTGSLGPASTTEDRSVQATDSIENPIAIQVTSETSEASGSKEHNSGADCHTEETCGEAVISFGPCAFNTQWDFVDSSAYDVASETVTKDDGEAGGASCNVHEDNVHAEGDISEGINGQVLEREMPTVVPEIVLNLQPGEETSGASTPMSCSTSCLHPPDVSLDETDKELTTKETERLCHLRSDEVNSCSPVAKEDWEAAESQDCFSQASDQRSTVSSFLSVDHSDQGGDVIFTFEDVSEASTPVAMVLDVGKVRDMSAEISTVDDRKTHQESDEELHHQLEHPPIKLLSNRKVLSPTTQEKLCQAVDAEEPVKPPKSGKRLWFEGKSNGSPPRDPVLRLSGLVPSPERIGMAAPGKRLWFERRSNWATSSEWIHRVPDTTTSPERASKRPKNGSVVPTKGILKSPPSWAVNSPAQKHTQEAITFSQRQMQDIESLASKLLKGLRSMKGIVEEALFSEESSSAASLKDQTDKMRAAIDNASELEETTKKWLSMMGKDCNRFCKILRSTLQKTPNGLRKDRKKITFADEAGGMLCHVKLFEDIV